VRAPKAQAQLVVFVLRRALHPPRRRAAPRRFSSNWRVQVWGKGVRTASPHDLLRDTLELNPEYRGLGQQDSQEFLRRILDVLHEELKVRPRNRRALGEGATPADRRHSARPVPAGGSGRGGVAGASGRGAEGRGCHGRLQRTRRRKGLKRRRAPGDRSERGEQRRGVQ
jgi:hypothetical protein